MFFTLLTFNLCFSLLDGVHLFLKKWLPGKANPMHSSTLYPSFKCNIMKEVLCFEWLFPLIPSKSKQTKKVKEKFKGQRKGVLVFPCSCCIILAHVIFPSFFLSDVKKLYCFLRSEKVI